MSVPNSGRRSNFATRLRQARKALGLSAAAFCKKSEIPYAPYQKWELGTQQPRDLDQIPELARHLKVSPSWLAFGIGEPDAKSIGERLATIERDLADVRTVIDRTFRPAQQR